MGDFPHRVDLAQIDLKFCQLFYMYIIQISVKGISLKVILKEVIEEHPLHFFRGSNLHGEAWYFYLLKK